MRCKNRLIGYKFNLTPGLSKTLKSNLNYVQKMNPKNNKNSNKRSDDNVHGFNSMGMIGNLNAMQGLAMDYENMDAHMPSSANQNPPMPAPNRARPNANPRPVGARPNPLGPSRPAPARPQAGPVSNQRVAPARPLPSRPAPA